MSAKQMGKTFLLLLEVLGILALLELYAETMNPVFLRAWNAPGNILFWISEGLLAGLLAYTLRKMSAGWSWKALGFTVHRSWARDIRFGLVIFSLFYFVQMLFSLALLGTHASMLGTFSDAPLPVALLKLTGVIFAIGFATGAFHEEIRYRGYIQSLFARESALVVGFIVSVVTFSLTHHVVHPQWNLLQILNTVAAGVMLCLAYHATGSLVVTITAHAIGNLVPLYAPFLYARGYTSAAYVVIFALAVVFIPVIIWAREDVKYLLRKSAELFAGATVKTTLLGLALAAVLLFCSAELSLVQSQFDLGNAAYCTLLLCTSLLCLAASCLITRRPAQSQRITKLAPSQLGDSHDET